MTLKWNTGKATVVSDGTAIEVVPARAGRKALYLTPGSGSLTFFGPDNTVTISSGVPLGGVFTAVVSGAPGFPTEAAIWAVRQNGVSPSSVSVSYLELYEE